MSSESDPEADGECVHPPSPEEFAGPGDGRYPKAPDPSLPGKPNRDSEPWRVTNAYRAVRVVGGKDDSRTCPVTGGQVPLAVPHVRATVKRDPAPRTTGNTTEIRHYFFPDVKTYVKWMNGEVRVV